MFFGRNGLVRLLVKLNIRKSIKTSVSFFLLCTVAMMLVNMGSQMKKGMDCLHQKRAAETNSADFAAVLPYDFCQKYQSDINDFQKENNDISELEITDAVLLKNADIQAENGEVINGSWTFRNINRKEKLSVTKIIAALDEVPQNAIYVPYVCKTFFGFQMGDDLYISYGGRREIFTIAGFTEDVLFGSRSSIIFDLPQKQFECLQAKAGREAKASIVLMSSSGKVGDISDRFSQFAASRIDEIRFYAVSDMEYVKIGRSNNINIYAVIINVAALISGFACFTVIGFHMQDVLDRDMTELGVLRAVGYSNGEIVVSYILQFILLGILGNIAGAVSARLFLPFIMGVIANDIGFEWENAPIGFSIISNGIFTLLMIGAVSLFFARRIISFSPIEAFQERGKISVCRKSRISIEKMPFPVNLSIVMKMIDYRKGKSVLISVVMAAVMVAAGIAAILYIKLASDNEGLLKITGAEVYSVNVQASNPAELEKIAEEIKNDTTAVNVMMAIEPGSSKLLCEEEIYASLGVYSDYASLKTPSLYSGRYPKHENEIAISGNLSKVLDKKIGDTVSVSQIFQKKPVKADYIIVGLTQGTYTGGMDTFLTMEGLRRIDTLVKWQEIHVYLGEDANAGQYCLELKKHFRDRISYAGEFEPIFYSQLSPIADSVKGVVIFIISAAFVIIVIMGFFVTNSILLTQKRDFAIMKALGYSNSQITFQVVAAFMFYIAAGGILGGGFLLFFADAVICGLFRGMGVYKISFSFPVKWIAVLFIGMEAVGGLASAVFSRKQERI